MRALLRCARTLCARRPASGPGICFLSDNAGWAIEQYARYTVRGLRRHGGVKAWHGKSLPRRDGQLVHFADRYRFLETAADALRGTRALFVTWFHGGKKDGFDESLDRLAARCHELRGVVTSCSLGKDCLVGGGVPSEKIVTIPLGVDTRVFQPSSPARRAGIRRKLGIPREAACVGSFQKDGVGWAEGLEPKRIKGPDVFVETVRRLHQRKPNLFVLLTGPARGYVKRCLDRMNVSYRHDILPRYRDLAAYYHALDLYVITSRCEGGPLALLESWATGCPVVSTRVGVAADAVRHGENGFLVDVDNVDGLVDCSARLLDDRTLREAISAQARLDVRQFDWDLLAARYCRELYAPWT